MKRKIIAVVAASLVMLTGCSMISGDKIEGTLQENMVTKQDSIDNTGIKGEVLEGSQSTDVTPETNSVNITLYYQDNDRYLIPITRSIVKQEAIARATINGLVDNSINTEEIEYYGLYPVLPEGTQIKGLTIRDGTAVIDFTSNFLQYKDARDERNIIACVVYTLTEFSTVKNVKILVEGKTYSKLSYGSDISNVLDRKNLLINAGKTNCTQGKSKFDAYYNKELKENTFCLVPVSFETVETDSKLYIEEIIRKLSEKPEDEKLFTELMLGTDANVNKLENRILTLDFNEQFLKYGGGTMREGLILDQIAYSMKQIDGVGQIKLLIEGEERPLLEGTVISDGILIKKMINYEILKD